MRRHLKVIEWEVDIPVAGVCRWCATQFSIPKGSGITMAEAHKSLRQQYDQHPCRASKLRKSRAAAADLEARKLHAVAADSHREFDSDSSSNSEAMSVKSQIGLAASLVLSALKKKSSSKGKPASWRSRL